VFLKILERLLKERTWKEQKLLEKSVKIRNAFLLSETHSKLRTHFNPIPAGVLENQDTLGGGQFDPPSKSHVLCPNMTNHTSLESSCALLLESAKKIANLRKLNFLSQNPVI
jgi:hypothetical protein